MNTLRRLCEGILLVSALAVGYSAPYQYHDLRSESQQYFARAMDVSVIGWSDRRKREQLNHVLEEEFSTGDFELSKIKFFNQHHDFSLLVLLHELSMDYVPSTASPINNEIRLNQNSDYRTMVHEVKHIKHFAVNKRDSDFMNKWYVVVSDEEGNTNYLSSAEEFCYRLRDSVPCLDISDKLNEEENQHLGFPTNYARVNAYEHIAELGTVAELDPNEILRLVALNPKYKEMLKCMEDAEIIAEGYLDFQLLQQDLQRVKEMLRSHYHYPDYMVDEANRAQDEFYLDRTQRFIDAHPNSSYVIGLREQRGEIYYNRAIATRVGSVDRDMEIALAEREFTSILSFEYKPKDIYGVAIFRLKDLAVLEGDPQTANVFDNWANQYYDKIWDNLDYL
jgi:hypothetical protein